MKNKTKCVSFLIFAAVLACLVFTGAAPATQGTITIDTTYDGQNVDGTVYDLYRVGSYEWNDKSGRWDFQKSEAFAGMEGGFEDLTGELAQSAEAFAKSAGVMPEATLTSDGGQLTFRGLDTGLYLVSEAKPAPGFLPGKPFLVSVPLIEEDGVENYHVNAFAKMEKGSPVTPNVETGISRETKAVVITLACLCIAAACTAAAKESRKEEKSENEE